MRPQWTDEEARRGLEIYLTERGQDKCPSCGKKIGPEDLEYHNSETEAGTGCISIEIQCSKCGAEVLTRFSWLPWAESKAEAIQELVEGDDDA